MTNPVAAKRLTTSLLLKFLLLLLLVIVPISALVGIFNYQQANGLLKDKVQNDQRVWAVSQRDALASELIQEGERMEELGSQDIVHSSLQYNSSNGDTITNTASLWQNSGENGVLRNTYVNSQISLSLVDYRQRFPNRAFVLLGSPSGALVGITTLGWPTYDLRQFAWWPHPTNSGAIALPIAFTEPQSIANVGDNLIIIITAVPDLQQTGRVAGYLIVGLSADQITNPILTSGDLAVGERTWLLNQNGAVLALYEISSQVAGRAPQISTISSIKSLPQTWFDQIKNNPNASGGSAETTQTGDNAASVFSYASLQRSIGYTQNDPAVIEAVNRLGWTVVRSAPQSIAYATLNSQLITLVAGTALTFIAIFFVVLITVGFLLLRPISHMEVAMSEVAHGDFSARVPNASNDELGRLGQRFNQMVGDLDTLLQERERNQREQQIVSERLQSSASELQGSVAQQKEFAVQQATALAEISATFGQLSRSATRIAQSSQQVAEAADVLQDEQHEGDIALQQTREVLGRLREDSESLEVIAVSLTRSSTAISEVMEELNNIADETKLLALNAAIEAGGAGAAGLRFAVIAHEVQALADQSNTASEVAQQSLTEVQENIIAAVASIQRELQAIGDGVQQSARLETLMHTISDTIAKLNQSAGIIQQDTKQQREGSVNAAGTIESLASASQQLAQRSTVITTEAVELSALAKRLNQASSQFGHQNGTSNKDTAPLFPVRHPHVLHLGGLA